MAFKCEYLNYIKKNIGFKTKDLLKDYIKNYQQSTLIFRYQYLKCKGKTPFKNKQSLKAYINRAYKCFEPIVYSRYRGGFEKEVVYKA